MSDFVPSRLLLWYNARAMTPGNERKNTGVSLRNGFASLKSNGVCSEETWKYLPYGDWDETTKVFKANARAGQKPPDAAYETAFKPEGFVYKRINPNLKDLKACLAEGYPFVFGVICDALFTKAARSGKIDRYPDSEYYIPATSGHAIMAIGYDDTEECFIIQNSWGLVHGANKSGYFKMTYHVFTEDTSGPRADSGFNFWTIRLKT